MTSNQPSALRNGAGENRYSKEQLLSLYKAQRESGALGKNVADYFVADWNPHVETSPTNGAWGKREDSKDNPSGPEVCWDHGGQVEPLGLVDMTDDEKEVCLVFVCPLVLTPEDRPLIHVGKYRAEQFSYFPFRSTPRSSLHHPMPKRIPVLLLEDARDPFRIPTTTTPLPPVPRALALGVERPAIP
jgi:hypothetical protein